MRPDIEEKDGTVKYLMLIYGNEDIWNALAPEDMASLIAEVDGFNEALRESGELLESEGLMPRPRSVQWTAGDAVVTDGPYIEAKEFVGSYFVVEVDDEQRALEIARAYPGLPRGGGLEVWPLMGRGWASAEV
ncbi:YciI family protein [Streptosporangium sp. NBC_01810]|uniref:YciI family protein n=1 Tax=Streptosporangium sp. NBC_01810 TaxID=2975951 RepID=UPI002DD9BEC2|nr:YciI family protein [Streptosporangium sp. NBC_01810]WSA25927.1 YciI family protein [Streptosporangium sp. NBC_01810]